MDERKSRSQVKRANCEMFHIFRCSRDETEEEKDKQKEKQEEAEETYKEKLTMTSPVSIRKLLKTTLSVWRTWSPSC